MSVKKIFDKLKRVVKQGVVHIFGTAVLNKIISMLTSIVVVRVLTKHEYGLFLYAYNIVTTLMAFSGLGTSIAQLQYGCENKDPEKRRSIEKTLVTIGIFSNVVFCVVTFLYAALIPLSMPEAKYLLMLLAFVPLFQYIYSALGTELRILEYNKKYALHTNIQTISYFVFACFGAWAFSKIGYAGSIGTSIGRYFGYAIPIVVGCVILKKDLKEYKRTKAERVCKDQLKYSGWVMMNGAISTVFYHLDVFVIGVVVAEASVLADYKVATQIPVALAIIPTAVVTFIYPKFVAHKDNPDWVKNNFHLVQIVLGILNGVIAIGGYLLAPYIIKIIYGSEYLGAVSIFRWLMISFFMTGTFRNIVGNILSMLHQIKANFYLGLCACVVNILADYFLIKQYGSIGAAYATVIVVSFDSIISLCYFYYYLRKLKKTKTIETQE